MLFAAITAAAISHFTRMSEQSASLTRGDKLKSNRDKLRRRLQTAASLDDAIFNSKFRPENILLKNCLDRYNPPPPPQPPQTPPPQPTCDAQTSEQWQPFILIGPDTGSPQMTAQSGSSDLFGKYDERGDPCLDPLKCIFQASSWFWVECDSALPQTINPNNPDPPFHPNYCQPSEVTLRTLVQVKTIDTVVKKNADGELVFRVGKTGDEPKQAELDDSLKRRKWSNKLALSNVANIVTPCKPGYLPRASTEGGVHCVKFNNATSCGKNQVFIGVDSEGKATCKNVTGKCADFSRPVSYDCTLSGCTQRESLAVNCGISPDTQWPGRLTKMDPVFNPQNCVSVGGASKKAQPGDVGTYRCTVQFNYRCCNEG